ncbi:MAG TPA: hypothetical protein VJ141_05240 [Candidatus Limnocylindrales bacterium]|nr:hypothetical protein [Candidatus Limnocylindrales bacterium]
MSAKDAVKAREEAKKPKRPVVVNVTVTTTVVSKSKPKREPIIDDFETDVPELVPEDPVGDE